MDNGRNWTVGVGTHVGDDTVESATRVAEAVLARCELAEVLRGLWHYVVVELEDDAASRLRVNGNVKLLQGFACQKSSSVAENGFYSRRLATWGRVGQRVHKVSSSTR